MVVALMSRSLQPVPLHWPSSEGGNLHTVNEPTAATPRMLTVRCRSEDYFEKSCLTMHHSVYYYDGVGDDGDDEDEE